MTLLYTMARSLIHLCFTLSALAFACSLNAAPAPAADLSVWTRPTIQHLTQSLKLTVGLSVADTFNSEFLVQHNADTAMIPASVMKTLTSVTALSILGPNATLNTELRTTGNLKGDTHEGPLYLVGSGDPLFVSERMWLFANAIVRLDIKKFKGPLYIDNSLFTATTDIDERRIDDAVDRAYNALLNPLSFNFNTTTIIVQPHLDGSRALVSVDPPNPYISIEGKVKIVGGSNMNVSVIHKKMTPNGELYEVSGTCGRNAKEKKFYRNIRNPTAYFVQMLRTFLEARGISFPAQYEIKTAPPSAKTILSFESLPLAQMIDGLHKFSNNFVADQILMSLAAQKVHKPGSIEDGNTLILNTLKSLGINTTGMKLINGSGLSHDVRITPNQVTNVLLAAQKDLYWGPYFVSSLSTSGIDGTLKDRLNQQKYLAHVKGKTGSIRGVSGLAGFVKSRNGHILAVTSFLNDPSGARADLAQPQDDLFRQLVDWK